MSDDKNPWIGSTPHLRRDHTDSVRASWSPACEVSIEPFPYSDLVADDFGFFPLPIRSSFWTFSVLSNTNMHVTDHKLPRQAVGLF